MTDTNASTLIEKTILKLLLQHQEKCGSAELGLDEEVMRTMHTFVNTATIKKIFKRLVEYKKPLSSASGDLDSASGVRSFLQVMAQDNLPANELIPAALKSAASTGTDNDQIVVSKWSELCKNLRNLCLIVRAYSIMDKNFVQLLNKIVDTIMCEMQDSGADAAPNLDIQQIMMSLMLRGDIDIAQLAKSMSTITNRDPDMLKECLGTVVSILKEAGVNLPELGALGNCANEGQEANPTALTSLMGALM